MSTNTSLISNSKDQTTMKLRSTRRCHEAVHQKVAGLFGVADLFFKKKIGPRSCSYLVLLDFRYFFQHMLP